VASATQDLELFVRDALAKGASKASVGTTLAAAGWTSEQVERALAAYADIDFVVPVPKPRASLSAREAFLYLVLFASLYVAAWHLGSLLFDLLNRALPDAADPAWELRRSASSMRWSTASVIIALPVFLWVARLLAIEVARDPLKRLSPVRRWLTYLTLFLAATALTGDMITLVYNALGGELSLRFALKVLVVAAIAGSIFSYYLLDLRREERA
jgi:hypothetical protein